jgi:hypothetical protein
MSSTSFLDVPLDYLHQMAGGMKDTHTVGEPSVRRSGVDQFGKAQLFHTSQTLKRTRLDDPPKNLLKLARSKFDEIVKWVPYPLRFKRWCAPLYRLQLRFWL